MPNHELIEPTAWDWIDDVLLSSSNQILLDGLTVDGVSFLEAVRLNLYMIVIAVLREEVEPKRVQQLSLKNCYAQAYQKAYLFKRELKCLSLVPKSQPVKQADICFWPVNWTDNQQFVPVSKSLKELEQSFSFFSDSYKIFNELCEKKIPSVYSYASWYLDFLKNEPEVFKLRRQIKSKWPSTLPPISFNGRNYQLSSLIKDLLMNQASEFIRALVNSRNIINQIKPKLVVPGNDLTLQGRVFSLFAETKGIKSASIMHGAAQGLAQRYHVVDKFLTFGEFSKNYLISLGVEASRLEVSGAPYLDVWAQKKTRKIRNPFTQFGLKKGQKLVVLGFSGCGHGVSEEEHKRMIELSSQALQAKKDIFVVAKLHPKDRPHYYDEISKKIGAGRFALIQHGDKNFKLPTFDWLPHINCLITACSSLIYEANYLEIPVISVRANKYFDSKGLLPSSVQVSSIDDPKKLSETIDQILNNPLGANLSQLSPNYFERTQPSASVYSANCLVKMFSCAA